MKLRERISWLFENVQKSLFPHLDECFESPLTEQEKRLVGILGILEVEKHIPKKASRQRFGRKLLERESIARAFVAKEVYRHGRTIDMIRNLRSTGNLRRICGFGGACDIPSESTFSRAFAEFAESGFGKRIHDALIKEWLSGELLGHISRDSTAITGREKAVKTIKVPRKKRKRGRPAKGERREAAVEKRLCRQVSQSAEEAVSELPVLCDRGVKMNAKGFRTSWNGYKLHLDTNDAGLPISALVTSASLHDSQVAIPLMKLSSSKVSYCYDLMDAAYDARLIDEVSRSLGHVPIIDRNPRRKEVVPMAPHQAERYKERSVAERANSRLKEDFGASNVMVRGHAKVTQHLMFGVITLFADQLIRLIG